MVAVMQNTKAAVLVVKDNTLKSGKHGVHSKVVALQWQ